MGIGAVDGGPGLAKLQSWAEGLHAEVVLFIDHEAEGLVAIEDQPATGAFCRVLAADEVAFDVDIIDTVARSPIRQVRSRFGKV